MQKLIDANVILRYILNDDAKMAQEAEEVIRAGAFITSEVLAEVVYVLKGVYQVDRMQIATALVTLLKEVYILNPDVYRRAFTIYASGKLDFVDCILAARHQVLGDDVFSFDKKLNKALDVME